MSETGHGADPRTARSMRPPRATAPAPAAAVTPPTRRGVLAAGAGAGAAALLGATGAATAAPAPVPAAVPAAADPGAAVPTPPDLAPYASYWFPGSLPERYSRPGHRVALPAGLEPGVRP
ncbi:hypothetical protein GCM10020254_25880 [Streptomyces goshikiensis]